MITKNKTKSNLLNYKLIKELIKHLIWVQLMLIGSYHLKLEYKKVHGGYLSNNISHHH